MIAIDLIDVCYVRLTTFFGHMLPKQIMYSFDFSEKSKNKCLMLFIKNKLSASNFTFRTY